MSWIYDGKTDEITGEPSFITPEEEKRIEDGIKSGRLMDLHGRSKNADKVSMEIMNIKPDENYGIEDLRRDLKRLGYGK